jgi:small subunit ribosomal protein S4
VYLLQLEEKQKARFYYGIRESELRRYSEQAARGRQSTAQALVQLMERRLDNVLTRLGLASTRAQARQFISHGHVLVDGKRVAIPSYLVRPGHEVRVKPDSAVEPLVRESAEQVAKVPAWLELKREAMSGRVLHLPERDEVDVPYDESLVVEFYSR